MSTETECSLCRGTGHVSTGHESGMYFRRCPWCRPEVWIGKLPLGFQLEKESVVTRGSFDSDGWAYTINTENET